MKKIILLLAIIVPLALLGCKKDEVVKKNEFKIGENGFTIESIDVVYLNGGYAEIFFFSSTNSFRAPLMNVVVNFAKETSLKEGLYGVNSNQAYQGIVLGVDEYYSFSGGSLEISKSGNSYVFEFDMEAGGYDITGYYKGELSIRTNTFTFQNIKSIISYADGYYTGQDSVLLFFDSSINQNDTLSPYLAVGMNSYLPTLYSFQTGTYNFEGSPLGFLGALVANPHAFEFNGGTIKYSESGDFSTLQFNMATLDGNITGSFTGPLFITDVSGTEEELKSVAMKSKKTQLSRELKSQSKVNPEPFMKGYLEKVNP